MELTPGQNQQPVCAKCGYDRTGLPETVQPIPCPECGSATLLRSWPGWQPLCLISAVPAWIVGLALAGLPSADLLGMELNSWLIFATVFTLFGAGFGGPFIAAMMYGTRGEDIGFRPTQRRLHIRCAMWTWLGTLASIALGAIFFLLVLPRLVYK